MSVHVVNKYMYTRNKEHNILIQYFIFRGSVALKCRMFGMYHTHHTHTHMHTNTPTLTFTNTPTLTQLSVSLQCIEEVPSEVLQMSAPQGCVSSTHSRHSEACHNTLQSQFALPIPLSVTQSFKSSTGTFGKDLES